MKLAWHIVRKDLVRLKWILLLWVVVLAAGLALASIQAGLDVEGYVPFYIVARVILSVLVPVMVFGLVMGLIHDDPVADIDVFWITRPISAGDLLAAKLLAWAVLGLLPLVVLVPFWLYHDYTWHLMGHAMWQTLGLHLILGALALPLAVVSPNGSRFVMNLMLAAGGFLVSWLISNLGKKDAGIETTAQLVQSRAWLFAGLWLMVTIIVTLLQFFRRKTSRSLAVLLVAGVLGFGIANWWPWGFVSLAGATTNATNRVSAAGVKFESIEDIARCTEGNPTVIAMEVPLIAGERASRRGMMLEVQFAYFSTQLEVAFSEATPYPLAELSDMLPGRPTRPIPTAHYFIINHSDGRGFAVQPVRAGYELEAPSQHYSHYGFAIRPTNWWHGNAPSDLAALAVWLKSASLVKVAIIGGTND